SRLCVASAIPRAAVAEATLSLVPAIFFVKKLLSSESDSAFVFTARNLALTSSNATSWALALVSLACNAVTAALSTCRNLSKVPCRSSFEPTPKPLIVPNDGIHVSPQPQRVSTSVYRLSFLIGRVRENLTTRNQAGLRHSGLGVLWPSVGDNLLELRVGEEHVIDIVALDRLVWSESYGQGANQSVGRVAEVTHQGAQLLLGRAQLCETEAVDLGNDGGDLGPGEKVTGATQDTRLIALGINFDELGETGLCASKNIVKADEKDRFFGDLLAAALVERV